MKKFVLVNHQNNAIEKLGDRELNTNEQKAAQTCIRKNHNRTVKSVRTDLSPYD